MISLRHHGAAAGPHCTQAIKAERGANGSIITTHPGESKLNSHIELPFIV